MISQIFENISSATLAGLKEKYAFSSDSIFPQSTVVEVRNIDGLNHSAVEELKSLQQDENFFFESVKEKDGSFSLLFAENFNAIRAFVKRLRKTEFGFIENEIDTVIKKYLSLKDYRFTIKDVEFDFSKSYVMGILNVTPDSFSDGGNYFDSGKAVEHALSMIDEGVEIIDIGGESTRPGAEPVDEEEEIRRTIPVIEQVLRQRSKALISIDTNKSNVAKKALQAGAVIVNDISAGIFDKNMLPTVAEYNACVILMHTKDKPKVMQDNPLYNNVITDIYEYLHERVIAAEELGIKNIIVDPGIGFGKTPEHNIEIINRMGDFKSLGRPVLIGLSRKSFFGKLLSLPAGLRDTASGMAESLAMAKGARIIRTHNTVYGRQAVNLFNLYGS